ncbi:MAG: hypothetical protein A2Z18_10580 [Armatimonadetes bacterium RBG_16_58_9]|nr:MAG: hypothetical protein A2Z18_10580 [Armatimonadetes bacterium RBG_16_58_9]
MLRPLTRRLLTGEVLSSLRNHILAKGLKAGDRLPGEHELASKLGVSRNTVREALKLLEAIGAVERRPKLGCVLQPVDLRRTAEVSQFLMVRSVKDVTELFIARRVLEIGILPLVARNATESDYERMESANRLIEAEIKAGRMYTDADVEFHQALLAGAHNMFLMQLGSTIEGFMHGAEPAEVPDEQTHLRNLEEHRQIVRSLRDGNLSGAERVMRQHLDRNVSEGVVEPDLAATGL